MSTARMRQWVPSLRRAVPANVSSFQSVALLARLAAVAATALFLCPGAPFAQTPGGQTDQSAQTGQKSTAVGDAKKPRRAAPSDQALAEAKALLQKGEATQAETAVRRFLKAHPDSADGHFLLGYILFDEIHEEYVGEEKKEGEGFRYNDTVDEGLGKLRDAKARESLAELSEGAKYRAASAFELKIVALDYVLLKDNVAADKWLTLSLKLQPKDAQGWFYLGRTKYSESQFPGAIEAFEQCLKLDPKNAPAEYNVGLSYEGLNQNDQAIQAYQTAIDWQSQTGLKSPEPFVYLARIYLNENEPQKAVPYLQRAVAAFPQASLAHEELGKAYSLTQQLPAAQEQLEAAVNLSPRKASLRCMLGQVYRRRGLTAKAQEEFERCASLQSTQSTKSPSARE